MRAGSRRSRSWPGSVRARIALACGGLFLVVGGALIAVTYVLVGHFSGLDVARNSAASAAEAQTLSFYQECRAAKRDGSAGKFGPDYARKCEAAEQIAALLGARSQQASDRHLFLLYSLSGLAVTSVLAGALGWALAGRVLRPVRAITAAARDASQENLDRRLALTGPQDELKELADTFDAMLGRLQVAFASQKRFVANASHELRTPLTGIRALIDVTMAKPTRTTQQLQALIGKVGAAVDRSEVLIEGLLTLARSDRGLARTETVDLPTAVADAIDLVAASAAAQRIAIESALEPAAAIGDRVMIERLVANLLDNAVRYNTPGGGWVRVNTASDTDRVWLSVANSGPVVPAGQVDELFEPFRRLTERVGDGAGLGLSIVRSVATAHGGDISARPRSGGGMDILVSLRRASAC